MTPPSPRDLPDPPAPARESRLARLRRRELPRGFDHAIDALDRAISPLHRRRPAALCWPPDDQFTAAAEEPLPLPS